MFHHVDLFLHHSGVLHRPNARQITSSEWFLDGFDAWIYCPGT